MDWLGWLDKWLHAADVSAAADEIAAGCRSAVWEKVNRRASALGIAEARGYIRVRAAQIVDGQIEAHLRHRGMLQQHRTRLFHLAMESVVRQATLDVVAARRLTQQVPAFHKAA